MRYRTLCKIVPVVYLMVLGAVAHTQPYNAPKCPIEGNWVLNEKFSDEFSGNRFDTTKWWDFNPAWVGRKPAFFSRDDVQVNNGILELYAHWLWFGRKNVKRAL